MEPFSLSEFPCILSYAQSLSRSPPLRSDEALALNDMLYFQGADADMRVGRATQKQKHSCSLVSTLAGMTSAEESRIHPSSPEGITAHKPTAKSHLLGGAARRDSESREKSSQANALPMGEANCSPLFAAAGASQAPLCRDMQKEAVDALCFSPTREQDAHRRHNGQAVEEGEGREISKAVEGRKMASASVSCERKHCAAALRKFDRSPNRKARKARAARSQRNRESARRSRERVKAEHHRMLKAFSALRSENQMLKALSSKVRDGLSKSAFDKIMRRSR